MTILDKTCVCSPPDCEERGERALFTKFRGEFVRHHAGPVLEEETLSGEFLRILRVIAAYLSSFPLH